jgi:excisionase family DNA binding protein
MDNKGLTISEAATLLGVHKNTIRNRIKDGTYKAEKVITERGHTWLIERESIFDNNNLTNNTLSNGSHVVVNQDVSQALQGVLEPFVRDLGNVREELGRERALRERAEQELAELKQRLEAPPEPRESPVSASEGQAYTHVPLEEEKPVSRWRSWLHRLFGAPGEL